MSNNMDLIRLQNIENALTVAYETGEPLEVWKIVDKYIIEPIDPITEPPFDWADVKHGMAFRRNNEELIYYISEHVCLEEMVVFTKSNVSCEQSLLGIDTKRFLTRAPEQDINKGE